MSNTPANEYKMRQQSTPIALGHGLNPTAKETHFEASSTISRFFRSRHVADLRLISQVAFCIILLLIGLMLAIVFFPTYLIPTNLNPGDSKSTDLKLNDKLEWVKFYVAYFGAPITFAATAIAWAYLSASKRLGIVDLFACEMSTLCRVGTIVDVASRYVDTYGQTANGAAAHSGKREKPPTNFVSQENYFPVFETNSRDLQALEAQVVIDITAFYTYMKATRDTQRRLSAAIAATSNGSSLKERHAILATIIKMLFLGYESGRKAVETLIEYEPTKTDITIMILITELKCYSFLLKHDEECTKGLYARIKLRESEYSRLMKEIPQQVEAGLKQVEKNGRTSIEWKKAELALPLLRERYDEVLAEMDKGNSGPTPKRPRNGNYSSPSLETGDHA
jgi:hypothetical protein